MRVEILVRARLLRSRAATNAVGSTFMPGPWVVEMAIDFMYVPFAVAGLSFTSVSSSALQVRRRASSGANDALPIGVWMMPAFSTRNSTRPALSSRDRLRDVRRDGADLRVRHQAAGTEDAADLTDLAPSCPASRRACRTRTSSPPRSS